WQVLDRRVVERQPAAIAQLHDGDAGERLRNRGPVEDRVFVDAAPGVAVLIALERLVHDAAVLDEHQAAADDARRLHALMVEGSHARPGVAARRRLEREQRGKDGGNERAKHAYS